MNGWQICAVSFGIQVKKINKQINRRGIIITMAQLDADPQTLLSLIFVQVSSDPKLTRSQSNQQFNKENIKQTQI